MKWIFKYLSPLRRRIALGITVKVINKSGYNDFPTYPNPGSVDLKSISQRYEWLEQYGLSVDHNRGIGIQMIFRSLTKEADKIENRKDY